MHPLSGSMAYQLGPIASPSLAFTMQPPQQMSKPYHLLSAPVPQIPPYHNGTATDRVEGKRHCASELRTVIHISPAGSGVCQHKHLASFCVLDTCCSVLAVRSDVAHSLECFILPWLFLHSPFIFVFPHGKEKEKYMAMNWGGGGRKIDFSLPQPVWIIMR